MGVSVPILTSTDNYILIHTDEHDADDAYEIAGTQTHVFPFSLIPLKENKFTVYQLKRGMQDGSLRMWFSGAPLDQVLFGRYDAFNPVFLLSNWAKEISLWDEEATSLPTGALTLAAGLTYYVNVHNMQASSNSYRLIFPKP
jgi:hypothetical protein